ncbi:MAG: 2-hydroxyacyl-CoA dehydratase [Oscillospiraceae bacterium]|nr:2-hydroxyacyl-CoA dehydratase [Oscillospiraceae bacterium]
MAELVYNEQGRLLFTEEMKEKYTILIPQMLPIHFSFFEKIFKLQGYNAKVLTTTGRKIIDEGLESVHNDACYPALLVIGQMIDALKSGEYDIHKTALMIMQTGGGCRASNYISLLRKALKKNSMEFVPVVSLNLSGFEKNPGFTMDAKLFTQLITGVAYGDLLMWLGNQIRPYEKQKGDTDAKIAEWAGRLNSFGAGGFLRAARAIVKDFGSIPYEQSPKIKVGIVGEVFIKFSKLGNNALEEFLHGEGVEVVLPGLLDMMLFMADHHIVDTEAYHVRYKKYFISAASKVFMRSLQNKIIGAIQGSRFRLPHRFEETKKSVYAYVNPLNKMGEGWLLTAEMVELLKSGVNNIICAQPFGCLPNHVVGKGMIRRLRQDHPAANIVSIDYDPGATKINQENRIKLMLSTAKSELGIR